MGQLRLNAINARRDDRWMWLFAMAHLSRWELTCGFCEIRFRKIQSWVYSTAVCPACGTCNLLPVRRFPWDSGPRPRN